MSRGSLGDATMTFGGDDAEFQKVAARVQKSAEELAKQWRKQSEAIASAIISAEKLGKALDPEKVERMKAKVAELSRAAEKMAPAMEESAESAVKFALKISYISYAGQAFRSVGKAVEEFTTKIALGQASMQDLIDKAISGIPIIGHFWEAGRDIRKAIEGDEAAAAKAQADTKAADEKIELQKKLAAAIQKVQRQAEDANQALNFDITKSAFFNSAKSILLAGEKTAQDRQKQRDENQKTLDDAVARKIELSRKLDAIRLEPDTFSDLSDPAFGGSQEGPKELADRNARLAETQKELDNLDKKTEKFRKAINELDDLMNEKGGRPTFTALFKLIGGEGVKAYDSAAAALKRYIDKLLAAQPELDAFTKKLLSQNEALEAARGGGIRQFNLEQSGLVEAAKQGLIGADVRDKLLTKSTFDQVARSIESFIKANAPSLGTAANFFSSGFLGPIRGLGIESALGNLGNLLPGSINTNKPKVSANISGLTELGSRIQASAAGGDPVVKKLDEVKEFGRKTAKNTNDLVDLMKNGGGGRAVVSKP